MFANHDNGTMSLNKVHLHITNHFQLKKRTKKNLMVNTIQR